MKKRAVLALFLSLMMTLCSCSQKNSNDNVYAKIHDNFYDIKNYTAVCTVTAYNQETENSYECFVKYDKASDSFDVTSDDIHFKMTKDKTVISKGDNVIESPALPEDMYIFVNSFFKSYYEGEETLLTVSAPEDDSTILLETRVINSTEFADSMKLWVNRESVLPEKMQILRKDGSVSNEIVFTEFTFE